MKKSILARICLFAAAAAAVLSFVPVRGLSAANEPPTDYTGLGIGYSSILYNGSNGLPTSEANAIAQTGDGFIWIGGYSGLTRYDGNEFYRYPSSTGITSVVCLFVDSEDRLWIGTNESGVAVLKDDEIRFYNDAQGMNYSIRAIQEDKKGNLVVATTKGLMYIIPDEGLHFLEDPKLNKEYICDLVAASNGAIYGVTLSGLIFIIDDLRVVAFYSGADLGVSDINCVFPDPMKKDRIFLGTNGSEVICGTLSEDMADAETIDVSPLRTINSINYLGGLYWIASDSGIGFLDAGGTFVLTTGLPMTNSVEKVIRDYEGNLWFTSSRQGVMKVVENRFTDVFKRAGLSDRVVNSTCRFRENLYIGTDDGLLILDADSEVIHTPLTQYLDGARIRCIKEFGDGKIWFCTYSDKGLVCYDADAGTISSWGASEGMPSSRVRCLTRLSDGTMAVATNAGVAIFDGNGVTAVYDDRNGIGNLEILCIEQMSDGRLLVGSDGDGIYIIDGSRVSRLGRGDGLGSEVILRIKKDPSGELFWIITSNSLAFMRDGTITTVKDFPYSNNFDLFFDDSDRIWILSSNGIYVSKRSDLLQNESIACVHYDSNNGLPAIATANSYSCLDADGTLYIAASTGVCSVKIFNEKTDTNRFRLAVPFIQIDDRVVWLHGSLKVTVPSSCRRLSIRGILFTYSLNDPLVSYWLEGFDDGPIYTTKRELSSASYTNLSGGTYRFHLNLINPVTDEIDQTLVLTIVKETAFYETVWFKALMIVAALAAVALVFILYYGKKTRKLLEKQKQNKEMINDLTTAFAKCIDSKDAYTNGHSFRVAKYASLLAEKLGKSKEEVEEVYNIALLHDIGKISIPDSILNKPGRLDDSEYAVMKQHPQRGFDILKDINIAPQLALGAGYHHEKYDGSGYPAGLKGDEIPEVAQIIAVADTFDAMYSTRPYRRKMQLSDVAAEIRKSAGTQLNPRVVEAFEQLLEEGAVTENGGEAAPAAGGAV